MQTETYRGCAKHYHLRKLIERGSTSIVRYVGHDETGATEVMKTFVRDMQ